ncbi:hypothetical protein CSA37_11665 [Candidatus Fermentibacteria bacterium]|nr:MAG: hypothetical protein CSA37_11665 [Candidatus Fermentibacteria bacterium]
MAHIIAAVLLIMNTTSPLLDVSDSIDRGGTAVYTVSLQEDVVYWIILQSKDGSTDLNLAAASDEMDFEHFMNLPYREDFLYALEYAIVSGLEDGDESITLPAGFSGPVHIVVHDQGGSGGEFILKVQ